MLGQNCQIHSNYKKTLKFAEVAQIREFCESRKIYSLNYYYH